MQLAATRHLGIGKVGETWEGVLKALFWSHCKLVGDAERKLLRWSFCPCLTYALSRQAGVSSLMIGIPLRL